MGSLTEHERLELARLLGKAEEDIRNGEGEKVRLPNGQLVRLSFCLDPEFGYSRATLGLRMSDIQQAILAGPFVLQPAVSDVKRIPYAARELWAARKVLEEGDNSYEAWQAARREFGLGATSDDEDFFGGNGDFYDGVALAGLDGFLREHRPGYDNLPAHDRVALLMHCTKKQKAFQDSWDEFLTMVEYGDPMDGLPNNTVKNANEYLRAAELKDILRMNERKVGKALGIAQSATDKRAGRNQSAGNYAKRGREIFVGWWGEAGYRAHVEAQLRRVEQWSALSQELRLEEIRKVPELKNYRFPSTITLTGEGPWKIHGAAFNSPSLPFLYADDIED